MSQLLTAAVYVLAARRLEPERFGYALALMTGALLLAGVLDFGCNAYLVREIAGQRMDRWSVNVRQTWKLAAIALCAFLAAQILPRDGVMFAAIAITASVNQTLQTPLRASGEVDRVAFALVIERLAMFVVFVGISVGLSADKSIVLAAAFGSCVGSYALFRFTDRARRFRIAVGRCFPWKGVAHFGLYSVSTTVQGFDLPLLALRAGPEAAGVFGAVNRWISPINLASNAFSAAAFPVLSSAKGSRETWASLRGAIRLLILGVVLSLGAALAAPILTSSLLGVRYERSASVLTILALGTLFSMPNQLTVVTLLARRRESVVSVAMVLVVVSQMIAVWLWAPRFGAEVAAWAFLGSQVLLFVVTLPAALAQIRRDRRNLVARERPSQGIGPITRKVRFWKMEGPK